MAGYYSVADSTGAEQERLDRAGLWLAAGGYVRAATADELAEMDTQDAAAALIEQTDWCAALLRDALALLPSMPLPDPDQQAQAQAQVDAALAAYRALTAPPADVVDLANKVSTHLQSNGYARMLEARAAYRQADAAFMQDTTISVPQLVAQVKALTTQLGMVRDA